MSAPARSSPSRPDPAFRSQFVANLYWVYTELPQLPLSSVNIFGLHDFDYRDIYAADGGPFLALHLAHRDAPVDLAKYTEDYFLLNQARLLDALHTTAARQFFVENLVLLGVLSKRFFVPVDAADDNTDWTVCDLQPPAPGAPDRRPAVWYNGDLDAPRQKIAFQLLSTANVHFKGIRGLGAGLAFRVPYDRILSLSMRPCLFADVAQDAEDVDMSLPPSKRLCAPSSRYVVRDVYYPTLFRLNARENRVLLKEYTYLSPMFVHTCLLASRNFFLENAEMRGFLRYFANVHHYLKHEYERRIAENACEAEAFLNKFIELILEIKRNKSI